MACMEITAVISTTRFSAEEMVWGFFLPSFVDWIIPGRKREGGQKMCFAVRMLGTFLNKTLG